MTDVLLIETNDRVRTLTLNRPKSRNALSAELLSVVDQTTQPTEVWLWLRPAIRAPQGSEGSVAHRLAARQMNLRGSVEGL